MTRTKMTPARRKALEWIAANEPVSLFPTDGSGASLVMAKRLRMMGLVEDCGREPGRFGFAKYRITNAGRAALQQD